MNNVVDLTKVRQERQELEDVITNIQENLPLLLDIARSLFEDGYLLNDGCIVEDSLEIENEKLEE